MKATAEKLLEEIAPDFNQFLKYGNLTSFTKEIDPNLNIDNVCKLLRIHFVLTVGRDGESPGVIDFVKKLPERLRRIKTTVARNPELLEGRVQGRINWSRTIKHRACTNPNDKISFVCDRRETNYNIAENLVLKSLLKTIHDIVYDDLVTAFKNKYTWLRQWVKEQDLREVLDQVYHRNVYIRRVKLGNVNVTERMISRTAKSRIELYREAADLLTKYRRLMAYDLDDAEAKKVLRNTFIEPKKTETLFELYWIIRITKQFGDPTFYLIEPETNAVASWKTDGYDYTIYHDSVGSCGFHETLSDLAEHLKSRDNYLGRELKVEEKLQEMAGMESDSLWGGRPDIVLEKRDEHGKLVSVFVGEVKYTQNRRYAVQGLKELLEYMALIKRNGEYLEDYENLFFSLRNVRGCLFLDHIPDKKLRISRDDPNIQVVVFGTEDKVLW